jgi:uncharacterized repeat protein (TIGR03803 family)
MTAVLTTFISFDNSTNGTNPFSGLIADANGNLFGTTFGNGIDDFGTVFEIVNNGTAAAPSYASTPVTLVSFNYYTNGGGLTGALIVDANGNLFGTTKFGGAASGTAFEIVNNGTAAAPSYASTPTTLVYFTGTNGALPVSGLTADANGNLFGTTVVGGTTNNGTVFEIANNGTAAAPSYANSPITLVNFDGTNGALPVSGLIADANGDLFGTTELGGTTNQGTVFEIANNGTAAAPSYANSPITLVSFNGTDGYAPQDNSLIADANGNLFGTTQGGGANNLGTVFEIVNNGTGAALSYASTPITLVSFNGTDGSEPWAGLIADANGDLFGTTTGGLGTVFEIVNNGTTAAPSYASTPITLGNFTGPNGEAPENAGLVADANGDLFGTTPYGGASFTPNGAAFVNGFGTVFEITGSGFVVVQPDHWTNTLGGNWSTATNWKNGVPTATLNANIDASGSYSVAITKSAIAYGLLLNDAGATVTNSGPLTLVGSGGTAHPNGALTINAGTFVLNGGALNAGTIFIGSGGTLQISKGTYALSETITNNGSITDKTTATITGAVSGTGSFTIANSAVLEFGAADSENVTFANGSKGTVKFDQSLTQPTVTISGLTAKDTIDLADLPFTQGQMKASYLGTATGGTLKVTNQSTNQSVSLTLVGNYLKASWTLSQDSSGTGTLVVDPPLTPLNSSPALASGPPGLDHAVALFNQYMAAGFPEQQGGSITTNALSQVTTNEQNFLANPHHG